MFISISIICTTAFAEVDSILFASDYQFYEQYTPGMYTDKDITSCQPVLQDIVSQAKADGKNIKTVVIGGDYTQNDGHRNKEDIIDTDRYGDALQYYYGSSPNFSIMEIKSVISMFYKYTRNIYVQGNHDPDTSIMAGFFLDETGPIEFDGYTIYVLDDEAYPGDTPRVVNNNPGMVVPGMIKTIANPEKTVQQTADNLNAYLQNRLDNDDLRPIFICSHQPIHENDSNRNKYAYLIVNAINDYAAKIDTVFFYGHTHEGNDDLGGGISYTKKGSELRISKGLNTEPVNINFTYLNYGFLGYCSGVNSFLSGTVIDVGDAMLTVTKYAIGKSPEKYKIERLNAPKGKVIEKNIIKIKIGSKELDKNGVITTLDVPAQIVDDRTMLPLRAIFEALGANVTWNDITQTAKATKNEIKISIQIGSTIMYKDDNKKRLDVPAQLINDRTMVPVRAIAESLDADVQWDEATETVTITMVS